ncbi:hypothetical protein QTP86_020088 [Hemibagrus guttatus]|nr:hypothetical protein QTP86_020088 [Hemibagrus guttatus]
MATTLFNQVFCTYGLPEDIILDRGPQFMFRVWKVFCTLLGINVSLISGYHPQSNGQTEQLNQEIGWYLRSYCSHKQQCWKSAHVCLQRAIQRQRIQADRHRRPQPRFEVGQWVWLLTQNLRLKLPCRKLSPHFIDPFPIVRQVNPFTYRLELPPSYHTSPTFHVSLLKPAHPHQDDAPPRDEPLLPLDIDRAPAYRVNSILNSLRCWNRLQYQVDWEDYRPVERLWVDVADILDPSLVEKFHCLHLNQPGGVPGGAL